MYVLELSKRAGTSDPWVLYTLNGLCLAVYIHK